MINIGRSLSRELEESYYAGTHTFAKHFHFSELEAVMCARFGFAACDGGAAAERSLQRELWAGRTVELGYLLPQVELQLYSQSNEIHEHAEKCIHAKLRHKLFNAFLMDIRQQSIEMVFAWEGM